MGYRYSVLILRKNDNCYINSNSITFNDIGIWIEDYLTDGTHNRLFIPYCNVLQIIEYKGVQNGI